MQTIALIVGGLAAFCIVIAMVVGSSPYLLRTLTEERPRKISDLEPRGKASTFTPDRYGKQGQRVIFKHDVAK